MKSQKISTASDQYFLSYVKKTTGGGQIGLSEISSNKSLGGGRSLTCPRLCIVGRFALLKSILGFEGGPSSTCPQLFIVGRFALLRIILGFRGGPSSTCPQLFIVGRFALLRSILDYIQGYKTWWELKGWKWSLYLMEFVNVRNEREMQINLPLLSTESLFTPLINGFYEKTT